MSRTIRKITNRMAVNTKKKRVAAYARVLSGKDAMLHSLSAQVSYYSAYIQRHTEWKYVGSYADEALTGTKDNHPEFQRLLSDCRAGKVDMVITKSISRFARNTVTLLTVTRELKEMGISILFEKEGIYSNSGEGEMILTLLASVAQEESRSVSENCKWRIRDRFKKGEPVNWRFLYGYHITKGIIEIEQAEAAVVQMIFKNYTSGIDCGSVSRSLRELNIPIMNGGVWSPKRIPH